MGRTGRRSTVNSVFLGNPSTGDSSPRSSRFWAGTAPTERSGARSVRNRRRLDPGSIVCCTRLGSPRGSCAPEISHVAILPLSLGKPRGAGSKTGKAAERNISEIVIALGCAAYAQPAISPRKEFYNLLSFVQLGRNLRQRRTSPPCFHVFCAPLPRSLCPAVSEAGFSAGLADAPLAQ